MREKIALEGEVRTGWLVEQLADDLDREELFEFIKALDLRAADYGFTKALRDHFTSAIEAEDAGEATP